MSVWILSALLAIGFVSLGLAKVLAAPSMRRRAARPGFTAAAYRLSVRLSWRGLRASSLGSSSLSSVCSRRPDRYCC